MCARPQESREKTALPSVSINIKIHLLFDHMTSIEFSWLCHNDLQFNRAGKAVNLHARKSPALYLPHTNLKLTQLKCVINFN